MCARARGPRASSPLGPQPRRSRASDRVRISPRAPSVSPPPARAGRLWLRASRADSVTRCINRRAGSARSPGTRKRWLRGAQQGWGEGRSTPPVAPWSWVSARFSHARRSNRGRSRLRGSPSSRSTRTPRRTADTSPRLSPRAGRKGAGPPRHPFIPDPRARPCPAAAFVSTSAKVRGVCLHPVQPWALFFTDTGALRPAPDPRLSPPSPPSTVPPAAPASSLPQNLRFTYCLSKRDISTSCERGKGDCCS